MGDNSGFYQPEIKWLPLTFFLGDGIKNVLFFIYSMDEQPKNISGPHNVRRNLTQGVDVVRLIFFNLMAEFYSTQCDFVKQINALSATVVNEMFSTHTDHTLLTLALCKNEIEQGISHIRKTNPDLIKPFTDSLLIHLEVQTLKTGRPPADFETTLQNAIDRRFFDETRGNPTTDDFLALTDELVKKYALNF